MNQVWFEKETEAFRQFLCAGSGQKFPAEGDKDYSDVLAYYAYIEQYGQMMQDNIMQAIYMRTPREDRDRVMRELTEVQHVGHAEAEACFEQDQLHALALLLSETPAEAQ